MPVAAPAVPTSVQNNTIYLYVLLGLVILGLLISFVAKNVPTVGKTIDGWVARRRRAAKAAKGAELADMRGQIEHLTGRVADLEADAERQRLLLTTHRAWDWQAVEIYLAQRMGQQAGDLPMPPPPLFPPPVADGAA